MAINSEGSLLTLKLLRHTADHPKLQKAILRNCPHAIQLISTICYNILRNNIKIEKAALKRLNTHKKTIRRLADNKINKNRKILLMQGSAFLPILLAPVVTALGEYLIKKVVE